MRSELTPDEADAVMADIPIASRRWCRISCGPLPGDPPMLVDIGCACLGCIYGRLSWDEYAAWLEREQLYGPTPEAAWILEPEPVEPAPPTLHQRLDLFKALKRKVAAMSSGKAE